MKQDNFTNDDFNELDKALVWFGIVVLSVFGIAAIAAYCGLIKMVWI